MLSCSWGLDVARAAPPPTAEDMCGAGADDLAQDLLLKTMLDRE